MSDSCLPPALRSVVRQALVIAGTHSGVGKTMITLGVLRALRRRGVDIGAAKSGPDYLDPMYHRAACGRDGTCINLDAWAMTPDTLRGRAYALSGTHTLIEGAMGLYDAARDGKGSTAQLVHILGVPVVLVINAQGLGQSAGAMVRGYHTHGCPVAGVILNNVGSSRHEKMLRAAVEPVCPVLGAVYRTPTLARPARHLGLVQAFELETDAFIEAAADLIDKSCDLAALLALMQPLQKNARVVRTPKYGHHIAVARDAAFGFSYPHQIDDWRIQGARISYFSPLANQGPDITADTVFLPGGYPELYAAQLAAADIFRTAMYTHNVRGTKIYGECGGYMTLGAGLVDADGTRHEMLGLLPLETSFARRKLHLGYYRVSETLCGHAFHYATTISQHGPPCWTTPDLPPEVAGLRCDNVSGSFLHLI